MDLRGSGRTGALSKSCPMLYCTCSRACAVCINRAATRDSRRRTSFVFHCLTLFKDRCGEANTGLPKAAGCRTAPAADIQARLKNLHVSVQPWNSAGLRADTAASQMSQRVRSSCYTSHSAPQRSRCETWASFQPASRLPNMLTDSWRGHIFGPAVSQARDVV